MAKLRYGIVGIGKQGSGYAMRLRKGQDKNAALAAVCDISPERRAWAKKNLKNVKIYENYKELIASGDIDAVMVVTPHYFHPEIAIAAMAQGKHVLIDKPAGVYTKAVREMNECAAAHPELTFGIMYNQRTNPLYIEAKRLIESGEMGALKRINWVITNWYRPQAYYDQGGWRGTWAGEGGGVLTNQCPHQLDLFQWLGGMPKSVRGWAKVGVNRDIAVENDVTFYTQYENGASGVFVTSTHDFPGTNRLELSCDGGQIVIEAGFVTEKMTVHKLQTSETQFNKVNTKFMPRIPKSTRKKSTGPFIAAYRLGLVGQHTLIIRNFSRAVLHGETLIAPGIDGIRGLTLSNGVYLSAWLDREVALPVDENLYLDELNKRIAYETQKEIQV
ncbi:MAG: Gfo/Idh/MocA family oxidoreductase [Oscillospiraceae bacterium]|nr:Gfo/Idh/MocA family oxidoreductase [Oscillospiraceae bacterium]